MLLRDLLAVPELRLALLAGEDALDREIGGVLITDLPDPRRYLSEGLLVLTGLMWRRGAGDSAGFVDALVDAGVAALGAGDARLGLVPDDLVEACRERGLPLIEVPVEVSFGAVTELVDRRITAIRAGDLRGALGRHRRIVAAVAEGASLGELFALVSAELGVAAAVVTAAGSVVAGDLPEEHAVRLARDYLSAVALPVVVRGRPGRRDPLGEAAYTVFAVDRSPRAAGWALVCRGEVDAEIGFELAACVAMERTRLEEGRRVERRLAEQLVALAFAGGDPSELSARLRTCGIDVAEPYAVVTATAARQGASDGPDPALLGGRVVEELLDRRAVAAAGADGSVALVPLRGTAAGELAGALRERAARLAAGLAGTTVAIGVSGELTGPAAIRGGVEEAGHARRVAEARGGGVVTSDEIYTHALLLATVPGDVRRSFADRLLGPLFDYDRSHGAELVRTLGAFLDCAGSWNGCAERLHVHVNTVRYRVRRIEELTGRDLSSMADRVDLFLALRAG
ncbi:PucR family transcriptional regulator ligand-binding domain-containing protein [Microbispora sp. RL4-1S]|uniref:PucR family transcriptional regulator ligand-binding domain-containing protein n=1 Tax=Microbispora oryzae TaxID=2806554 RepID=A0A941AG30_9ACTN|nr:PucR family transcriptional regulator [Microbispora oryzae]MBP2702566.1 PucR family transcriptional regulator ligand-binding domain-containing protein [Microbispora oryzae]